MYNSRIGKLELVAVASMLLAASPVFSQVRYQEQFENLGFVPIGQWGPSRLINDGWLFKNNSQPVGSQGWYAGAQQGMLVIPFSGTSYLATDADSAAGGAPEYSLWAILPAIADQQAGDVLTVYTISTDTYWWIDAHLEIRYAPNGGTNTGTSAASVGDFTQLLEYISPVPNSNTGIYNGWTKWDITLPGPGRIALRQVGPESLFIGIEDVSVANPDPPTGPYPENFEDLAPGGMCGEGPCDLVNNGWTFVDQSTPSTGPAWQPNTAGDGLNAHSGFGCIKSVSAAGQVNSGGVNNWAILPDEGLNAGDTLSFFATAFLGGGGKLQLRYSPTGGINTGSGLNGIGDFTQLLVELDSMTYGSWQLVTATIPGNGRVAIRFHNPSIEAFSSIATAAIDTVGVNAQIPGPPLPQPGQTVTWTVAMSPISIDADIAIPAGGVVIVDPGVVINILSGHFLAIAGELQAQGTAGSPVTITGDGSYPQDIAVVNGGTINLSYTNSTALILSSRGCGIIVADSTFTSPGMIFDIGEVALDTSGAYIQIDRCTFTNSGVGVTETTLGARDSSFTGGNLSLLRGYAMVNNLTFNNGQLSIAREADDQPVAIHNVSVSNVATGGGLNLEGSNYFIAPSVTLQNNQYPVRLRGGLLPGSVVPPSGNVTNAVYVPNFGGGNIASNGIWAALPGGLPYIVDGFTASGARLEIMPGTNVKFTASGGLGFISTGRLVAEGTPQQPINFSSLGGQGGGLVFGTQVTGPRVQNCIFQNLQFGVIASESWVDVDDCTFTGNGVAANANTFGYLRVRKSRFQGNGIGVQTTGALIGAGSANLSYSGLPNAFTGNGTGVQANAFDAAYNAQSNWWNSLTGPQSPLNPGGQGDSITGAGAGGVGVVPFLTTAPDFNNHPPVVRVHEPYLAFLPVPQGFKPGSKVILNWDASDDDSIVSQKIVMSLNGNWSPFNQVLASNLPGTQRSFEWTVPDIGSQSSNDGWPFIRIVATDSAGQEGFDQFIARITTEEGMSNNVTFTTVLSQQTFVAGSATPICTTGDEPGFNVDSFMVFDGDRRQVYYAPNPECIFGWTDQLPYISSDTARVMMRVKAFSNHEMVFVSPEFAIRPDPRLGLQPPTVQLLSPLGGTFSGGSIVNIAWAASAAEGLRGFDIVCSTDAGQTWQPVVTDLPNGATSYQWRLPPSVGGIPNLRVRVIASDHLFQTSATPASNAITITPGDGTPQPGDVNGDGVVNVNDLLAVINAWGKCPAPPAACPADLTGDHIVNVNDLLLVINNWG